jgi:ADP-ribose pyrophosphatase YjhB (NUDIX family)
MIGVNICIIQNGKILLTKREDFEVWCLPGGAVDPGESVAQAAIRETREETGLEVKLTWLIGIYSRTSWFGEMAHIVSFLAEPVGGQIHPDPREVIEIGYFSPDDIPEDLLSWSRQRITDAFSGVGGGVAWSQELDLPFPAGTTRADLYRLRDESGLSRRDFYFETLGKTSNAREILELGPEEIE